MDRLIEIARALLDGVLAVLGEFAAWTFALLADVGMDPGLLLWVGGALVAVWVIAALVFKVADFLVHLLLGGGLVLLGVWAILTYLL